MKVMNLASGKVFKAVSVKNGKIFIIGKNNNVICGNAENFIFLIDKRWNGKTILKKILMLFYGNY